MISAKNKSHSPACFTSVSYFSIKKVEDEIVSQWDVLGDKMMAGHHPGSVCLQHQSHQIQHQFPPTRSSHTAQSLGQKTYGIGYTLRWCVVKVRLNEVLWGIVNENKCRSLRPKARRRITIAKIKPCCLAPLCTAMCWRTDLDEPLSVELNVRVWAL